MCTGLCVYRCLSLSLSLSVRAYVFCGELQMCEAVYYNLKMGGVPWYLCGGEGRV